MSAHAPAPWTWDVFALVDARGRVVAEAAQLGIDSPYSVFVENDADRALIVAAPDLLDALKYALPYIEACVPSPRNGVNADYSPDVNCVARARAAIAKAEGTPA